MTHLELIAAVSNYVAGGETLSTTTYPTKAQVTEWLNGAQDFIATILPWKILPHVLVKSWGEAITTAPIIDTEMSDCIEIISVAYDYGSGMVDAQQVTPSGYRASVNHEFIGTSTSPVWSAFNGRIYSYPIANATIYVEYKARPTALSGDSDTSDLGNKYDQAMVVYAVSQFYKQNEQLDLYSKYFNEFLTILKGA